ncbi:MAG TPA: sulfite exporter TauE/SafE family protein [Alphaproteobacteria bacterium]|nr:sulfite exporter TauE/SafE family protein [Alphaproteobacteria bacterium]
MDELLPVALAADHAAHLPISTIETAGALVGALFVAGLAGGAAHCAGMCGPFVLAQAAGRLASVPAERFGPLTRLRGALLLPYHLGRTVTYAALGAIGATLVGGLAELPLLSRLQTGLLTLAALLMLAAALEKTGFALPRVPLGRFDWPARIAASLLSRPNGPIGGFAFGVALGFLPCGFLYGALTAASASGDPVVGAAAMAGFALGTAPALFAVALLGEAAGRRWRRLALRIAPAAFAANAVLLAWTAWRLTA